MEFNQSISQILWEDSPERDLTHGYQLWKVDIPRDFSSFEMHYDLINEEDWRAIRKNDQGKQCLPDHNSEIQIVFKLSHNHWCGLSLEADEGTIVSYIDFEKGKDFFN